MKISDLKKEYPDGHDFRICSSETRRYNGIEYYKSIWVEWTEVGKLELRKISELNISYLDNEYSFEIE